MNESRGKSASHKILYILLFACIAVILVSIFGILNSQKSTQLTSNNPNASASAKPSNTPVLKTAVTLRLQAVATDSGKVRSSLLIKNTGANTLNGLHAGVYLRTNDGNLIIALPPSIKNQQGPLTQDQLQQLASASAQQKPTYAINQLLAYNEVDIPSVEPGKEVSVPVEIQVPAGIKSDQYKVESVVFNDLGMLMSSDSKVVPLKGSNGFLTFAPTPCQVIVNNKPYDSQVAPLITPGQQITGECEFKNTSSKTVTVASYGGVYGVIHTLEYPQSTKQNLNQPLSVTINPNETKKVTFAIPDAANPQVYESLLQLKDTQGQPVSSYIVLRWTVKGPSAVIQSAGIDRNYYAKGDTIAANFQITPSLDLFWGNRGTPLNNSKLVATVVDSNNQTCGTVSQALPQAATKTAWPSQKLTFASTINCNNPKLEAQIFDGGTKLAEYNHPYVSPATPPQSISYQQNSAKLYWAILFVAVLTLLIVLGLLTKKGCFGCFKNSTKIGAIIIFGLVASSLVVFHLASGAPLVYGQSPSCGVGCPIDVTPDMPATFAPQPPTDQAFTCRYSSLGSCNPVLTGQDTSQTSSFIYGGLGVSLTDNGNGTSTFDDNGYMTQYPCDNDTVFTYVDIVIDGSLNQHIQIGQQGGGGTYQSGNNIHLTNLPTPTRSFKVYRYGWYQHNCNGDPGCSNDGWSAYTQNNVIDFDRTWVVTPGPFTLNAIAVPACSPTMPVALSWTAASNADSYDIIRTDMTTGSSVTIQAAWTSTSYTDSTPKTSGTTYQYQVVSNNNAFGTHSNSNVQSVTIQMCTHPVTGLNGTGVCTPPTVTVVNLSWTDSADATTYNILRDGAPIAAGLPAPRPTGFSDLTAPPGASHTYEVDSVNAFGTAPSAPISVNAPICDPTPPVVSFSPSSNCYDTDGATINPALDIDFKAYDSPPNPTGIASVTATMQDLTAGTPATAVPFTCSPNPIGLAIGDCHITSGPTANGHTYKVNASAVDLGGNPSAPTVGTVFTYSSSCVGPWIQTQGGDVHSNKGINTPGGPP